MQKNMNDNNKRNSKRANRNLREFENAATQNGLPGVIIRKTRTKTLITIAKCLETNKKAGQHITNQANDRLDAEKRKTKELKEAWKKCDPEGRECKSGIVARLNSLKKEATVVSAAQQAMRASEDTMTDCIKNTLDEARVSSFGSTYPFRSNVARQKTTLGDTLSPWLV